MVHPNTAPTLLKARQRHWRWLTIFIFTLFLLSAGKIRPDTHLHEMMDALGVVLVGLCALGRSYCSLFIGGIKNERVVRSGPFSIVRNPLYVFSFIGLVGIGLQSGMITYLAILVGIFILYYHQVVVREEAFLLNKFGDDYQRYLNEVPRWWANFSLWQEPEEINIRPRFIRYTMRDAMAFIIAYPAFELIEILHREGLIVPIMTLL
jgi:protein-S-isoprenylcysteine O-methyltransferase Ste14